jgi:DNA-binding NarL/FixJ family response regulator
MMKNHQEEDWLRSQIDLGKSSRNIANENNISYKTVELYLRKFNIPFTPKA